MAHILIKGVHVDPGYYQWQVNRLNYIISLYGEKFFRGKKILELGSFEGGVTQMFHNLGANITGVEGSERNLQIARERYPHLTFVQGDCDDTNSWPFDDNYDIIIHWGLLYHLKDPERSIDICLKHADLLFLESLLLDKTDSDLVMVEEDNLRLPDQGLHGRGCRPTVKYVEDILDKYTYHTYKRHDTEKLDSSLQPKYSLPVGNTGELIRKFWIVKRKIVLFDVGCHDGKEFLKLAEKYPNDVVVYGFEPTPWAAAAIREKTKDLKNFHVVEQAVSNVDGKMDMTIAASDINHTDSGCNSLRDFRDDWQKLFPDATPYYGGITKVPVTVCRLDTFMRDNKITHVTFLHVDAQGEDLNVVDSLGDRKKDVYEGVIELATIKTKTLYKDNPDLADGLQWMAQNGFVVTQITPNDPVQQTVTTEHNLRFKNSQLETPVVLYKNYYIDPYSWYVKDYYIV